MDGGTEQRIQVRHDSVVLWQHEQQSQGQRVPWRLHLYRRLGVVLHKLYWRWRPARVLTQIATLEWAIVRGALGYVVSGACLLKHEAGVRVGGHRGKCTCHLWLHVSKTAIVSLIRRWVLRTCRAVYCFNSGVLYVTMVYCTEYYRSWGLRVEKVLSMPLPLVGPTT